MRVEPVNQKKNKSKQLIYIPTGYNLVLIKNIKLNSSYFYIWSRSYYTRVPLTNLYNSFSFDYITQTLTLESLYINNYTNLYFSLFSSVIHRLFRPYFTKLKFKGKGYYLYKNSRGVVTPQFGYSHRLYLYTFFTHVTFLNKTTLVVFGLKTADILSVASAIHS